MTNHKTCDVLECVCGVPWEPDSEQFGCWSCGSTSPSTKEIEMKEMKTPMTDSCQGCKYDKEVCAHPQFRTLAFYSAKQGHCYTSDEVRSQSHE